ncbi:hypothetical protein HDU91_005953 [Kappamyces sp. JEL0680]|nr:hypothetical protein HDU91_005953 [Kappamyces sp. JEL0680]
MEHIEPPTGEINGIPLEIVYAEQPHSAVSLATASRLGLILEPLEGSVETGQGKALYVARRVQLVEKLPAKRNGEQPLKRTARVDLYIVSGIDDGAQSRSVVIGPGLQWSCVLPVSPARHYRLDSQDTLESLKVDHTIVVRCESDPSRGLWISSPTDPHLATFDHLSYPPHTSERAAISSVISCIQHLNEKKITQAEIVIVCDPRVEEAVTSQIPLEWIPDGWKSPSVVNRDLYELLWNLLSDFRDVNANVEIKSMNPLI